MYAQSLYHASIIAFYFQPLSACLAASGHCRHYVHGAGCPGRPIGAPLDASPFSAHCRPGPAYPPGVFSPATPSHPIDPFFLLLRIPAANDSSCHPVVVVLDCGPILSCVHALWKSRPAQRGGKTRARLWSESWPSRKPIIDMAKTPWARITPACVRCQRTHIDLCRTTMWHHVAPCGG